MPEATPSILGPYVNECLGPGSLALITSTLSTPASWLVVRYLNAVLKGTAEGLPHGTDVSSSSVDQPRVSFINLLRPAALWVELAKKVGLDVVAHGSNKSLLFFDGLVSTTITSAKAPLPTLQLKTLSLTEILAAIQRSTQSTSDGPSINEGEATKSITIIDGLDFLLAAKPDVDNISIQQFISQLRLMSKAVIVTCSADSPLLHNRHDSATPLERDHAGFATLMSHRCDWILQLRGLDTGTARDVTGVLRASKGGSYEGTAGSETLDDAEWLYQLKSDGSVRMWTRGE